MSATQALLVPGRYALASDTDKRMALFLEQRAERGFDDSEVWSLDGTLVAYAVDLVDSLASDGETAPEPLAGKAAGLREKFSLYLEKGMYPHEPKGTEEEALDDLLALIAAWPAFAVPFARFAAPRIEVLARRGHGHPGDMSAKEWADALMGMVAALRANADGGTGDLGPFRQRFGSLWD
jgi:hypothetical protein